MSEDTKDEDTLCNKCGRWCLGSGLIKESVFSHYFSPYFPDGEEYIFSLCEPCLDKLFRSFHIPPKTYNYINSEIVEYGSKEDIQD